MFDIEKKCKSEINSSFLPIIFQNVLSFFGVFIFMIPVVMFSIVNGIINQNLNFDFSKIFSESSTVYHILTAIVYIFSLFVPFAFYFTFKKIKVKKIISFKVPKAIDIFFAVSICLMLTTFGQYVATVFEYILSLFGIVPAEITALSLPSGLLNIIIFGIQVTILPAFFEEFAYRGVILGSLSKYNKNFAIIASSIAFSLMHGTLQQIPFAFIYGLIISYFVIRFNTIWIGVIVHLINNSVYFLMQVLQVNLSEIIVNGIYLLISLIFVVTGLICFLIYNSNYTLSIKEENEDSVSISILFKALLNSVVFWIFVAISLFSVIMNYFG